MLFIENLKDKVLAYYEMDYIDGLELRIEILKPTARESLTELAEVLQQVSAQADISHKEVIVLREEYNDG